MNQNRGGNRRNENENQSGWFTASGTAIGVAVAAGLTYWLTSGSKQPEKPQSSQPATKTQPTPSSAPSEGSGMMNLINWVDGSASTSDKR